MPAPECVARALAGEWDALDDPELPLDLLADGPTAAWWIEACDVLCRIWHGQIHKALKKHTGLADDRRPWLTGVAAWDEAALGPTSTPQAFLAVVRTLPVTFPDHEKALARLCELGGGDTEVLLF